MDSFDTNEVEVYIVYLVSWEIENWKKIKTPLKWKNTVKLTNIHFPRYKGTIKLAYLVYNYV